MRLRITRSAARDLERIFSHVAADSPRAAADVVSDIEQFLTTLAEHPDLGRPVERRAARMIPVPRLPYLVLFRQQAGELQILNVRHGRRRALS